MSRFQEISEKCIECGLCMKDCCFLQKYGVPKAIAETYSSEGKDRSSIAFECSLCELCSAVCPVGLNPAGMFLEMRREAVRRGGGKYPGHSVILNYEKRGSSKRYSYRALPEGCKAVFFPGCNLPGSMPRRVTQIFEWLQKSDKAVGIVLDCCMKPSHDLGREEHFRSMFGELRDWLLENGVRTVLTACPSCHKVLKEQGGKLEVKSVYEQLCETPLPDARRFSGAVTVHDSCAARFEEPMQKAVRKIIENKGLSAEEMAHRREKTLCCGEGGSAGFLAPELAQSWKEIRKGETSRRRMIVYCGGCAHFLGSVAPISHILDLVFEPEAALSGKVKISKAPFTYWNRLRLKRRFKRMLSGAPVKKERATPSGRLG